MAETLLFFVTNFTILLSSSFTRFRPIGVAAFRPSLFGGYFPAFRVPLQLVVAFFVQGLLNVVRAAPSLSLVFAFLPKPVCVRANNTSIGFHDPLPTPC